MSIVVPKTGGDGARRLYTKGASEVILALCTKFIQEDGTVTELTEEKKVELENNIINSYADDGLRTLCLAYKELDETADVEDQDSIEVDLTMIVIVGIEDPVRPEVPGAIAICEKAGITVRMVTGDNIKTAMAIAGKCGILPKEKRDFFISMEGPEFRERCVDETTEKLKQEEFDKIWPRLRVLARSRPKDKYTLVTGLFESNLHLRKATLSAEDAQYVTNDKQVIAVTGDGTNDAPALAKADVGFAMGIAGTQVAKDACDIILMDDNFSSIVKACMWGRNVYDSIGKFLQFQLTVNVVAVLVAAIGALFLRDSPLRATQLLWVNLIMDSLASLALATEPPTQSLLDRPPYGRNAALVNKTMMKHIMCMSVYQMSLMLVFIWYGDVLLGVPSGRPVEENHAADDSESHRRHLSGAAEKISIHYTMLFNAFVLMTLFNEINSRKLHDEKNVFKGFFSNPVFTIVLIVTFVMQILMVQFMSEFIVCVPLTADQWVICTLIGLTVFPVRFIITFLPSGCFGTIGQKKIEAPTAVVESA